MQRLDTVEISASASADALNIGNMPSTHTNLHTHIVFSTKDRIPSIRPEWSERLHAYLGGIVKGLGGTPVAIGGVSDHVHVLSGLTASHRFDYFVRDLKADSSAFVRKTFDGKFAWQKGYGAFSVSPSALQAVAKYVLNQVEHHRSRTFESEYVDLLEKSGTPYDEKYLW